MATPVTDDTFRCELRFVGEYVIRYRGREIPVRSTYVEKLFALIGGPEPTRSVPLSPGRACTIFHAATSAAVPPILAATRQVSPREERRIAGVRTALLQSGLGRRRNFFLLNDASLRQDEA